MVKKIGRKRAGGRRPFGAPSEAHQENFEQQHQGASESISHARDAVRRGDCAGALEDLVDSARHVGAAANELVAMGSAGAGSDGGRRLKEIRQGLSLVQGAFKTACLRRSLSMGRK